MKSSAGSSALEPLIAYCRQHPAPDVDLERFLRHLSSGLSAIVDRRDAGVVGVILDRARSPSGAAQFHVVGSAASAIDAATAEAVLYQALAAGRKLGLAALDLAIDAFWAQHRPLQEAMGMRLAYCDLSMRSSDGAWGPDAELPERCAWHDLTPDRIDDYLRLQKAAFAGTDGIYAPEPAEQRRVLTTGKVAVRILSDGTRILAALRYRAEDAFLYSLVRDPAAKGRGLGRLMLDEARRRLPGRALHLDVVSSNRPALELYRRHGFEIVRELDVMSKRLRDG